MRIGILPLGRPTFDVSFAKTKLKAMLSKLAATGNELIGPHELLFDEEVTRTAIAQLQQSGIDQLLLFQVTFTDSSMAVAAAKTIDLPLSIWAVPEPRLGGRLRLNSFCGLNLAAHALGLHNHSFGWLYADPEGEVSNELKALLDGKRTSGTLVPSAPPASTEAGERVVQSLKGRSIARIGEHPLGFDTSSYQAAAVQELTGVEVTAYGLDDLFTSAKEVPQHTATRLRAEVETKLDGLDQVDQQELERSLRLKLGLDSLRRQGGHDAFAIRCWPETFTEYGGAVCGPAGMMAENLVPCACEADVYGAITQLLLLETSGSPVFLTDLVDMDAGDNTGVVWHCGQAPLSMCDPEYKAEATVHTNRKKPLLFQFPLKPGRVTLMRLSQARGRTHMVLAGGEMLRRSMAFTGTSGVLRFDRPVAEVLVDIIDSGLEHHVAIAYGDYRETLRGACGALGLPLLEL